MVKESLDEVVENAIEFQKKRLLDEGSLIVPTLTSDDVLQPNDFPQLENDPNFRYEEGYLHGLQAAKTLFLSWQASCSEKSYFE